MQSRARLSTSLRTGLRLTPGVQLALKFLRVPTLELEALVRHELSENPVLEIADEGADGAVEAGETPLDEASEACESSDPPAPAAPDAPPPDWTDYLPRYDDTGAGESEDFEGPDEERGRASRVSLQQGIAEQLGALALTPRQLELAELLAGCLDDRGYLCVSLESIAEHAQAPLESMRDALGILQSLDPPGLGARSLAECLALQLKAHGLEGALPHRIVTEQFEHLAARRTSALARALRATPLQIEEACARIRQCHPAPGRLVGSEEVRYIHPDLVVDQVGAGFEVWLNDRHVPRLRLDPHCRRLLAGRGDRDAEARAYVQERLRSARWIVQALDRRRDTMLRVMRCIVGEQRMFFEHGISHLKPMTLQTVADKVGLHESTVARVTYGKYVQTPRGLFALKYFFSSRLRTSHGEDVSARTVRARLRSLIALEDRGRPLADDEIAALLGREGVRIARRTIAKYRDQLGIERASLRRRRCAG